MWHGNQEIQREQENRFVNWQKESRELNRNFSGGVLLRAPDSQDLLQAEEAAQLLLRAVLPLKL